VKDQATAEIPAQGNAQVIAWLIVQLIALAW
jgi:hypothetical protein